MNIDELINIVNESELYKAKKIINTELRKMGEILMILSGLTGALVLAYFFSYLSRTQQPIEVTIGLSIVSVVSLFSSMMMRKRSNKKLIEIANKRKEIVDEIIKQEKEIIQLMNSVVPDKDINFSNLKLNFINKNHDQIITCLDLLIKDWFKENYTTEEKLILSKYDIEMDLKKEKEMNYTYKL